ncbi:MAG: malectin domain-containing carbohydrate-binding protein [Terriglobia bacterium]
MRVSDHGERNELEHVLSSGIFAKAPRQAGLLKYICDEYFQGRADQIKEYTLAIEVLGREADFDQNRDAIVRVEVHRLRKKLKEYYQGEGAAHSLQIVIDPGKYVPRFVPREKDLSLAAEANSEAAHPRASRNHESPQPPRRGDTGGTKGARFRAWPIALGGLALAAVAVAVFLRFGTHLGTRVKVSPTPRPSALAASTGMAGSLDSVRILCGYPQDKYIDRAGNVWLGDRYYSGGQTSVQPLQFPARAPDVALYQSFRFGDFSYDIPLRPGNYELHLYFLETHYGPGSLSGGGETSRMFNVLLNGQPLLKLFDIIKDAGGNNIGDERVFKDVTPAADGHLHLNFRGLLDSPLLNALAIVPAPRAKINPIRIVAQNNSYTDRAGNIWSPDRYYRGGQLALHLTRTPISGTRDPGLYSSERFGNFSYTIPVPPGKYKVNLRFAETYWGIQNAPNLPDQNDSQVGGGGSRVFDVYCNGIALLRNFDIFKEAGGALVARDKTFHNLEPDAQGKLNLSFVPVRDYACVNAIEVEDDSD